MIFEFSKENTGLAIELKIKPNKPTKLQLEALDQLNKSGGGNLLFKPGTYTVTSNLTSYTDIALIGSNPGNE